MTTVFKEIRCLDCWLELADGQAFLQLCPIGYPNGTHRLGPIQLMALNLRARVGE